MIFLLVIALKKKISNAASIDPQDRYFVGVVRMLSFQLILLLVCLVLAYTAYKNIWSSFWESVPFPYSKVMLPSSLLVGKEAEMKRGWEVIAETETLFLRS